MNSNLNSLFLEATCNVFQLMLDLTDISNSPVESFQCDDELDISIGVTGDLVGAVIYRLVLLNSRIAARRAW